MLNRAGTTFRKLDDADKQALTEDKAIGLMAAPAIDDQAPHTEADGKLEIGFKPERYAALFSARE